MRHYVKDLYDEQVPTFGDNQVDLLNEVEYEETDDEILFEDGTSLSILDPFDSTTFVRDAE